MPYKSAWVWTKGADEMDWLQRWLFVTCDVISFHLDQESQPTRFLAVHRCTITDSGSAEFVIEWNNALQGSPDQPMPEDPAGQDEDLQAVEVRCCDRQECAEFLDALHRVEVIPVETVEAVAQTDLTWADIAAMLAAKDAEILRLQQSHTSEMQRLRDKMTADHQKALAALELRCSRLLEAEVRREATLRELREELLATMRRIRALEADAAQIELLGHLVALRTEHLAWLQHHLCSEQIARFGLALKRAGQVVVRVRGCEQMSAEFSRAWPIVEHLVELPRRYMEEELVLRHILKRKHHPSNSKGAMGGAIGFSGSCRGASQSPPATLIG